MRVQRESRIARRYLKERGPKLFSADLTADPGPAPPERGFVAFGIPVGLEDVGHREQYASAPPTMVGSVLRRNPIGCRLMAGQGPPINVRFADTAEELDAVEPLWNALQEHHARLTPNLGGSAPKRELAEAWRRRRTKYEHWLDDPESFFLVAESGARPVGYAFITVGPGFASWQTSDRIADLQTLSVLPEQQGIGVGTALLEAMLKRLAERGIKDVVVTSATTNVDSHKFYERHGFQPIFHVYYRKNN